MNPAPSPTASLPRISVLQDGVPSRLRPIGIVAGDDPSPQPPHTHTTTTAPPNSPPTARATGCSHAPAPPPLVARSPQQRGIEPRRPEVREKTSHPELPAPTRHTGKPLPIQPGQVVTQPRWSAELLAHDDKANENTKPPSLAHLHPGAYDVLRTPCTYRRRLYVCSNVVDVPILRTYAGD